MSPSPTAISSRAAELLLLLLFGCAPYSDLSVGKRETFTASSLERIFGEQEEGTLYQAEIELYDRYFTGLMVIKEMEGPRSYRVAFMSEMGVKFIDMAFKKERFELKQCFDKIDKQIVTSRFRKGLRLLLMCTIEGQQEGALLEQENGKLWRFDGGEDGLFYYHQEDGVLQKAESAGGMMKKKKLILRFSWGEKRELPQRLVFEHQDIELEWTLQRVEDPQEKVR